MALNYSGLSKYIDQLNKEIVTEAVSKAVSFKYLGRRTGIKNSQMINLLKGKPVIQGGACISAANAQGGMSLEQRELKVSKASIVDAICIDTFEEYWMGMYAKVGSYNESLPDFFNKAYVAQTVANVQAAIEEIFWQGDTTGSGNLALADGMLKILRAASATIKIGQTTGTGLALTSANAISTVRAMLAARPAALRQENDQVLFMSMTNFDTLANAYIDGNLFNWNPASTAVNYEMTIPGTNVKAVGVAGFGDRKEMVLASGENLIYGTDGEGDSEQFKMDFDSYTDTWIFRAKWKQGAQVAIPAEVVFYTGVPA